jgi:hypothetical protein
MKIDKTYLKEKLLPILFTALLSAVIAMLQNILIAYTTNIPSGTSEVLAGGVGTVLSAFKFLK